MKIAFLLRGQIRNPHTSAILFRRMLSTLPKNTEYKVYAHTFLGETAYLSRSDARVTNLNALIPITQADAESRLALFGVDYYKLDSLESLFELAQQLRNRACIDFKAANPPAMWFQDENSVESLFEIGNYVSQHISANRVFELLDHDNFEPDIVVSLRYDSYIELNVNFETVKNKHVYTSDIRVFRGVGHVIDTCFISNYSVAKEYYANILKRLEQIVSNTYLQYAISEINPINIHHHLWTLCGTTVVFKILPGLKSEIIRPGLEDHYDLNSVTSKQINSYFESLRVQSILDQQKLTESGSLESAAMFIWPMLQRIIDS